MGKQGLPEITDRFTYKVKNGIIAWDLEGKQPWQTTICIWNGYKINTQGQVIRKNIPLKPIFRRWNRAPHIIMTLNRKDTGKDQKEERIDNLMEKYFWPYIEWYSEKKLHENKEYIVVPKDGNWNILSLENLEYVLKEDYNLSWTKKALLIELIPFFDKKSDDEIAEILWTTSWWVRRIKGELKEKGRIGDKTLNKLIISHKTYKIYIALLACKWLQSNLDIAKELRAKANFENKEEQDSLTDKVSRVRRKLYEKWLIQKYNTYQKEVNISGVKEELKKMLIANRAMEKWKRKTHTEIAKAFNLTKGQVDNFSRQIPKEVSISNFSNSADWV